MLRKLAGDEQQDDAAAMTVATMLGIRDGSLTMPEGVAQLQGCGLTSKACDREVKRLELSCRFGGKTIDVTPGPELKALTGGKRAS